MQGQLGYLRRSRSSRLNVREAEVGSLGLDGARLRSEGLRSPRRPSSELRGTPTGLIAPQWSRDAEADSA